MHFIVAIYNKLGISKDVYDKKHQEFHDKLHLLNIEPTEHTKADFDYQTIDYSSNPKWLQLLDILGIEMVEFNLEKLKNICPPLLEPTRFENLWSAKLGNSRVDLLTNTVACSKYSLYNTRMYKKLKIWLDTNKRKALSKKESKYGISEEVKQLTKKHQFEALALKKILKAE